MMGLTTAFFVTAALRVVAVSDAGLYERSLEQAVARAQTRVLDSVELWQDHSTWANPWSARSGAYEVRTTQSWRYGKEIASGLDGMLANYRSLLGTQFAPDQPFPVFVLPSLNEYNRFGEDNGETHSSILGSFFSSDHAERPVASMHTSNWTQQMMWLTHSAVHQYVDRAYGRPAPLWIEEGLASYFALFWDFEWAKAELERIETGEGRYVPLAQLLADPIEQYTDRPSERLHQLGMFFAYVIGFREDTRTVYAEDGSEVQAPFAEFVRGVLAGTVDPNQGVIELLDGQTLEELERDFRACTF